MTSEVKKQLINECRDIFIDKFEAGGGYGFRFYHSLRAMKYAEKFLKLPYFKNMTINKDAVIIASLFHDVGKIAAINKSGEIIYSSNGNKNHAAIGGVIVHKYLAKYVKDEKLIDLVAKIIDEQHGKKQTAIESMLVKDTDRFDNYGFIQIWRNITHAHYDKRNIDRLDEFWNDESARKFARGNLVKFNFPVIKKLAGKRFKKLDYLFAEIKRECTGEDIN